MSIATVLTALLTVFWVSSGWIRISLSVPVGRTQQSIVVLIRSGSIGVYGPVRVEIMWGSPPTSCINVCSDPDMEWWEWNLFAHSSSDWMVFMPLWAPVVLAGVVMTWMWRRHHTLRPTGSCAHCGYDLRGNASGVCPECGQRVRS